MDSSNTLDGRTPAIGWICAGVATAALATAGLGVILMTEAGQLLNLPSAWVFVFFEHNHENRSDHRSYSGITDGECQAGSGQGPHGIASEHEVEPG
jgi:hypothetical protein